MTKIEIEIAFEDSIEGRQKAMELSERLMNGDSNVARKHGKWVLFISCLASEILHLGQELHYELDD